MGETDEAGHLEKYDAYLESAHLADQLISDLWATLQKMKQYQGKTTLIITTDHGRGGWGKLNWVDHGDDDNGPILESSQIWMGFMGPDTTSKGEVTGGTHFYQKQMAQTIAKFLNLKFESKHPVAPAIKEVLKVTID